MSQIDDSSPVGQIAGSEQGRRRPSRRGWMLIASALTTGALLAVALLLPVPFVKMAPGPTFNVIGEADGQPVIQISGAQTYPVTGNLDMTTVLESGGPRGGLTLVDAVASWLDPSSAVVPRELLFPDDISGEEVRTQQAALFNTSESNAIAAALNNLGLPVRTTVVVDAVYSDTPADGAFEARDEIISVDGVPVTSPSEVVDAVRSKPVGTALEFTVRRDDASQADVDSADPEATVGGEGPAPTRIEQTVKVTTADNPDDPGTPVIGIGVSLLYAAEFPIDFTLEDVGGPSAGQMFAIGLIDKLSPGDLAGGQHIAGTGTITPEGQVGPIGGIRQKLAGARNAGATLFLMPAQHCQEAEGHIPDGLTVVPVTTLDEGVTAIENFVAGTPVVTCPLDAA